MDYKPLLTLLAIVNPLAIIPFFIHYTHGFTREQRRRTIWVASFSAFVVIATSALLGLQILQFFSISLASFQVGGGMLLLTSALSMLNAQPAEAKSNADEINDAARRSLVVRDDRAGSPDGNAWRVLICGRRTGGGYTCRCSTDLAGGRANLARRSSWWCCVMGWGRTGKT